MGRKAAELVIRASLSDHNDDQDELDRAAWERFIAAVRELASQRGFDAIEIYIDERY